MKLIPFLFLLVGCQSELAGCISLSHIIARVNQPGDAYCWTHTNHREYCVVNSLENRPTIKPAP